MLTNYRLAKLLEDALLKFRKVSRFHILYILLIFKIDFLKNIARLEKFYDQFVS